MLAAGGDKKKIEKARSKALKFLRSGARTWLGKGEDCCSYNIV